MGPSWSTAHWSMTQLNLLDTKCDISLQKNHHIACFTSNVGNVTL